MLRHWPTSNKNQVNLPQMSQLATIVPRRCVCNIALLGKVAAKFRGTLHCEAVTGQRTAFYRRTKSSKPSILTFPPVSRVSLEILVSYDMAGPARQSEECYLFGWTQSGDGCARWQSEHSTANNLANNSPTVIESCQR
jgi:hypothetical protein